MQQSQLQFDLTSGAAEAVRLEVLHAARRAEAGHRDELLDGTNLREPWQRFFALLAAEGGLPELARRNAALAEQIRRNGVTYNVYSDAAGRRRPWPLGLLPLLIDPIEWRAIETGIAQRARLMEAVLADCYGAQTILGEGLLPPALLHGHPGYLHALKGVVPVGGQWLHVSAFDIARGPEDSGWWVVSQRTQAPSGLGYVLENRVAVSRQFPEAFREMRVQHIATAYRRLLDTLLNLAAPIAQAAGHGTPRLALLTPGPYNETYFEQTYLARYLGLPLVEGGDLTVRDERLYLKTVQGLEPVHGLLRRLDDDWCDPLELRPDSALGVPGLLQVLRAGRVVMANALGTGFLESPGVQGFLPALAQRLLGETLSLPSLPTWWCGEEAAWAAAREGLAERVVRPTYPGVPGRSFEPVIAATLAPSQLAAWRARIEAHSDLHTIQRYLKFAQTPWWQAGELQPRTAMLRVYAIADGRGGHRVLPGGMTRVAGQGRHAVSIQHGGASLDTWVLSDGPVDVYSMLPQRLRPEEIALHRRPVSSRTAENLFWMGRYTERTEHLVRLALAAVALVEDDDDTPPAVLDAVSKLAESAGLAPAGVPSLAQSPRVFERAVVAALDDTTDSPSIAFNLAALDRVAGALRDRLSPEHGRLVRAMAEDFSARRGRNDPAATGRESAGGGFGTGELESALEHLATQLAAVTGAQSDRMTRDDGWRLLTVGRLTERLIAMSAILRAFFSAGAVHTTHGFDLLLGLFDSTITYRSRHPGRQEALALLDLVVIDTANPRALGCVLRRLRTELGKLPGGGEDLVALLPPFGAGATLVELCRDEGDEAVVDDARVVALADMLLAVGGRLSDEVGRRYFALADRQEQHLMA